MCEAASSRPHRRRQIFGIGAVLLLVPLYFLSVGPAVGIADHRLTQAMDEGRLSVRSDAGFQAVRQAMRFRSAILMPYQPVFWIARRSPDFDGVMKGYFTLWESPVDARPGLY